jgi:hypothetical protein
MLNSPFLITKADQLATAIRSHSDPLEELHLRLFAAPPDEGQQKWARDFLQRAGGDHEGWSLLCHTLLISNDFLYLR